ncbi:hypothetical protein D3C87_1128330 [compost metagenome]
MSQLIPTQIRGNEYRPGDTRIRAHGEKHRSQDLAYETGDEGDGGHDPCHRQEDRSNAVDTCVEFLSEFGLCIDDGGYAANNGAHHDDINDIRTYMFHCCLCYLRVFVWQNSGANEFIIGGQCSGSERGVSVIDEKMRAVDEA